jgi:hypothetical protein
VKLKRALLIVHSHRPKDAEHTGELVENWFRERAHFKFRERLVLGDGASQILLLSRRRGW